MKFSLPYRCHIPKFGQVPVKILTDDGRPTTHGDGRQPIAILARFSDSGDLKSINLHKHEKILKIKGLLDVVSDAVYNTV